jgi:hypothetical protein
LKRLEESFKEREFEHFSSAYPGEANLLPLFLDIGLD